MLSQGTGVAVSYNIPINNSFIIHVLFGAEMLDEGLLILL